MHKMERIYVVNWFENMKFIRAEMNISQKYLAVRIFFRIFFGALRIHSLDFIDVALFRFSKFAHWHRMRCRKRIDQIELYSIVRHVKTTTTINSNSNKNSEM